MTYNELWNFSQKDFDQEQETTKTRWKYKIVDRVLYLCFEYTGSVLGWIYNFFFIPRLAKPYRNMPVTWFVHAGFRIKWRAVKDWVGMVIKENLDKIDGITITGHSQGGALATLAHEYVKFNFPALSLKTITFGAPRAVFFWNFKKVKDRFEGITHLRTYMDIVPHLPPKLIGYKDTGERIVLGKKKFHIPFPPRVIVKDHTSYGDYLK